MLVVGIAGGTGSGKTTVVNRILERLPEDKVTILPQDAYYKDNSGLKMEERQEVNFDHPDSVEFSLLIDHLNQLKAGKTVHRPIYSYHTYLGQTEKSLI
jgi:uridine kinase